MQYKPKHFPPQHNLVPTSQDKLKITAQTPLENKAIIPSYFP